MKRNRILALAMSLALSVSLLAGCQKAPASSAQPDPQPPASSSPAVSTPDASNPEVAQLPEIDLAVISGPTGVGASKMLSLYSADAQGEPSGLILNTTIAASNDEITPQLINGSLDIAATATNVAANLYNKTEGQVTMLAINTEGVLYILEKGNTVTSLADLAGKTLYAPSNVKGANPEFILNYLLKQNGVDPATDLTIEWLTPQEITAKMTTDDAGVCMLPVPAATAVLVKDGGVREALDLSAEWDKVCDTPLVMGCVVARTQFVEENPELVEQFLDLYEQSILYMDDPANLEEAAALVAQYGFAPNTQIAKLAIPQCNLTYLDGEEMQQAVQGYYDILYQANPASVGGAMPYDDFYYLP